LPVDEVEAQVWTNPGIPSRLEIVYLADLMKALGLGDEIDFVLADCVDGFQANYTRDQIEAHRPYLILTIEGAGPEEWAYQNGLLRYGPHYLRIAEPGQLLDPESKMPFGVTRLRFARFAAMAAEFYESPWEDLEDTAARGREIYMNACVNCHALDQRSSFGGEKSSSLLRTLAIQAESQQAYFKGVVRHPARILGSQDMTAFPHYTEAEFEALFAFLGRY
jgi:mono/diheme cytochrome c family protein